MQTENTEPNAPGQIVFLEDSMQELHIIGQFVVVAFTMKATSKDITVDGQRFTGNTWERDGSPYIDFASVRKDRTNGTLYKDDDSPVQGGLSIKDAEVIIQELTEAIRYMDTLPK